MIFPLARGCTARAGLPQPTLRLGFIAGAHHPGGFGAGLSFARVGAAHYHDAAGLMQGAAADQPHFDFDPVTLTPRGLLLDLTATNHLRQMNNISVAPWVAVVASTSTRAKIADYRGMAMAGLRCLRSIMACGRPSRGCLGACSIR